MTEATRVMPQLKAVAMLCMKNGARNWVSAPVRTEVSSAGTLRRGAGSPQAAPGLLRMPSSWARRFSNARSEVRCLSITWRS